MRKAIMVGTLLAAVVLAATVGVGAANAAAVVVNDAGCVTNFFGTTCTVIKTTANATTTPSGNVSYVTNGTVERRIQFSFGGSYTSSSIIHMHILAKDGEIRTSSEHHEELIDYVSGTWFTSCVSSYDIHWANGDAQFIRSELACETPCGSARLTWASFLGAHEQGHVSLWEGVLRRLQLATHAQC